VRSVAEHLAACLDLVRPLPPIEVALPDALGCRLAQDVVAGFDMPRFDNSSMDGYAVRTDDLAELPVVLPVAGDAPAGSAAVTLAPGTALRITTGAPVPAGADTVVQVEWTDGGTSAAGQVRIDRAPAAGRNIRRVGEDVRAGRRVLAAGTALGARHVSLLATVGVAAVRVHPRPRVVVLPTGSELVAPGEPLSGGQIHDSNGYGLVAAARQVGALATHGGIVRDDAAVVAKTLADAAAEADLVVTSGGVSKGGEYDVVKHVLEAAGDVEFVEVAMQPGKPQGAGVLGPRRTPVLTLPGNPVSALVSFEVFVVPVLRRLAGQPPPTDRTMTATVTTGWRSPAERQQYTRATLTYGPDGATVAPVGAQGSHLVSDLADANCLAVVPVGVSAVEPGDRVECLPFDLTIDQEGAL
jgi:molybdopterin molybdotransferase